MTGVSLRGGVYWFRGRIDGRMVQKSLETADEAEAIRKWNISRDEYRRDGGHAPEWGAMRMEGEPSPGTCCAAYRALARDALRRERGL